MLASLDQSLLVLILTLQFLLASHVTDIANDKQFAVHVAELTRLNTDFEQDILLQDHCLSTCGIDLFTIFWLFGNFVKTPTLPAFSEQIAQTLVTLFLSLSGQSAKLRIIALLVHELLGAELVGNNALNFQLLLRVECLVFLSTQELLEVLIHKKNIASNHRGLLFLLV